MKRIFVVIMAAGALVVVAYLSLLYVLRPQHVTAGTPAPSVRESLSPRLLLKEKLEAMVREGSDSLYSLTLGDLKADVLQSTITLVNIALVPDSAVLSRMVALKTAPDRVFSIRLDSFRIDGIGLNDMLTRKTIDLDTVHLRRPVIEVDFRKRAYNKEKRDSAYARMMRKFKRFSVKEIRVVDGTLVQRSHPEGRTDRFTGVGIKITGLRIDSASRHEKDRFLFSKDVTVTLQRYSMLLPGKMYNLFLGAVRLSSSRRELTVSGLKMAPVLSKRSFQKNLSFRKEWYRVGVSRIQVAQIDWDRLLAGEGLKAAAITISNPALEVYLDRTLPAKPRMGNYPHQMLMKAPIPVHISRVNVRNGTVVYEEFNPASGKSGKVVLDRLHGHGARFTNIPEHIRAGQTATFTVNARFMRLTPLSVSFRFPLAQHRQGVFSASVAAGGFDATGLNGMLEPMALVSLKSGMVKKVTAHIAGNNHKGSGKVMVLYNDLKLTALQKEEGSDGFDKKKVLSFLANTFVIRDNNPSGNEAPRTPYSVYQRDPKGGFFNVVWKTLLVGILKTVGAPEKLAVPPPLSSALPGAGMKASNTWNKR